MITIVNLNPSCNGGERATATIEFEHRAMKMEINAICYGSHSTTLTVYFDSPEQMKELAEELLMTAEVAKVYFKNHE